MIKGCYVSPIPLKLEMVYNQQIADYVPVFRHHWPRENNVPIPCNPRCCRECNRERDNHDHGESDAVQAS